MADQGNGTLVSDAEIEAALQQAAREVNIPTLDEDGGVVAIPIPVQAGAQPVATARSIEALEVPPPPEDAAEETVHSVPAGAGLLYRIVDRVLWTLNRPFTWLRPEDRQMVGWLAIVTIVMALLATILLPRIAPNRHFLTDLKDRSQAVASPTVGEEPPGPP